MNKKRGIRGFIAAMLSVLLLAGCGRIPEDDSGSPRPAVYVNDTIYMEIYEAEQSLPEGWEARSNMYLPINRKWTNRVKTIPLTGLTAK